MTSSSTICLATDSTISNDRNDNYSKQTYWDQRYRTEEHYDWFASVYNDSVEVVFQAIEDAAIRIYHDQCGTACHRNGKKKTKKICKQNKKKEIEQCKANQNNDVVLNDSNIVEHKHNSQKCEIPTIKVLHLGIGNSRMAEDIEKMYYNKYKTQINAIINDDDDYNGKCCNDNNSHVKEDTLQNIHNNVLYKLEQIAVDYSEVVIAKMKERYLSTQRTVSTSCASSQRVKWSQIHWVVADIRDLAFVRHEYGPTFDLVVDKGTMDALEASEDENEIESNITQALQSISACFVDSTTSMNESSKPSTSKLTKTKGRKVLNKRKRQKIKPGQFIQITWQVPFKRLVYTIIDESNSVKKQSGKESDKKRQCTRYAWGSNVKVRYLGDSDLYRVYTYTVSESCKKKRVRVKKKRVAADATKTEPEFLDILLDKRMFINYVDNSNV